MPAAWVSDEGIWKRAKKAVQKYWGKYDEPWAVVTYVYKQMGGGIRGHEQEVPDIDPSDLKQLRTLQPELFQESLSFQQNAQLNRKSREQEIPQGYLTYQPVTGMFNDERREVEVILITEGPGNTRDKNYYTKEAIVDGIRAFEGVRAFLNHQTEGEAIERPEQDVRQLCGFYRECRLASIRNSAGRSADAVAAVLVLDDSEAGREAYAKAKAEMMFRKMFPNSAEVYAGLSIYSDGVKDGELEVGGEKWNRIVGFVNQRSVDVVTRPARGGAFVRILESVADNRALTQKEVREMKVAELKKLVKKMTEAEEQLRSEKDQEKRLLLLSEISESKKQILEAEDESDEAKKEEEARKKEEEAKKKEDEAKKARAAMDEDESDEADENPDDEPGAHADEEQDKELIKKMMQLMPQKEDETEEAYKERCGQAVKMARKQSEAASVEDFRKKNPKLYRKVVETVHSSQGAKAMDFKKLREENKALRTELTIIKDKAAGVALLAEAGIPERILSPSDLVGLTESEMKRRVEQTKALMETAVGAPLTGSLPASRGNGSPSVKEAAAKAGLPMKEKK